MKRRIRRTHTTRETHERVVFHAAPGSSATLCPHCEGAVLMLNPEEAARLCGIPVRSLFRRVEMGTVHYLEAPSGALLICPKSISQP